MRSILIISALFCVNLLYSQEAGYPSEWWENPNIENPPSWEILPHEAGPGEVILSKRTELGILSNFSETPFKYRGESYRSLEGFWQMMKYPEGPNDPRSDFEGVVWQYTRAEVSKMIAFEAKKAGSLASKNMEIMDINWVSFEAERMPYRNHEKGRHYQIIYQATWEKIKQNKKVKEILLATGDLILRPDHKQKDPPPAWQYYNILMELRALLQEGEESDL